MFSVRVITIKLILIIVSESRLPSCYYCALVRCDTSISIRACITRDKSITTPASSRATLCTLLRDTEIILRQPHVAQPRLVWSSEVVFLLFFCFRRRAAEQKAKAESLQVLEVPAELAFILSKIDDWQPPHADRNVTKV